MAITNVEKDALGTGENIDINRRESPFKVIILQIVLKNSQQFRYESDTYRIISNVSIGNP